MSYLLLMIAILSSGVTFAQMPAVGRRGGSAADPCHRPQSGSLRAPQTVPGQSGPGQIGRNRTWDGLCAAAPGDCAEAHAEAEMEGGAARRSTRASSRPNTVEHFEQIATNLASILPNDDASPSLRQRYMSLVTNQDIRQAQASGCVVLAHEVNSLLQEESRLVDDRSRGASRESRSSYQPVGNPEAGHSRGSTANEN